MGDMTTSAGVPEVAIGSPGVTAPVVPATFSGKWSDMEKDMAAIAAEQGQPAQPEVQPQAPATAPTEAKPVQPKVDMPVPAKVEPTIPEKFKGPDGKLDQDKIVKSYLDAEKALKQAQNKLQATPTQPQPATLTPNPEQQAPLNQFELQVAQDLFRGGGYTEQQAVSTARVLVKLEEAKHQANVAATFTKVQQFEQALEEQARARELDALAKDPRTNWVLTPQGQQEMIRVRQENPYLNQSPEPWRAAAMFLLGNGLMQGVTAQVQPNPSGVQQAQPLPVSPVQPPTNPVPLNTPEEIERHLRTLNPQQEAEFWRNAGFPWKEPAKQAKVVY